MKSVQAHCTVRGLFRIEAAVYDSVFAVYQRRRAAEGGCGIPRLRQAVIRGVYKNVPACAELIRTGNCNAVGACVRHSDELAVLIIIAYIEASAADVRQLRVINGACIVRQANLHNVVLRRRVIVHAAIRIGTAVKLQRIRSHTCFRHVRRRFSRICAAA